eukprot:CAMPEP_0116886758 /NCGR_PEP_ID=MMETSP0463-20121206/20709_1 /TAXON_ID=181622 /ORGANISM="Strombidinopsis sp, Strain SopsisLIS2011" /LENGTH=87 /DNA_ID=CAMNT_0004547701 /DNA_START=120 /DNA_END=383 /DNA_ORIENTATION=-
MYGFEQTRTIVITDKGVYNVDGKDIKRVLLFSKIKAIIKHSAPCPIMTDFVIHMDQDYDYYYRSPRRDDIIRLIKIMVNNYPLKEPL